MALRHLTTEDLDRIFLEIEGENDRAAIIVSGSLLEGRSYDSDDVS
jgi:hypothetical protein